MNNRSNSMVDNKINPLGIKNPNPLFTYVTSCEQTAYRIFVSTSANGTDVGADMWDSGIVKGSKPSYIKYAGKKLSSRTKYFYKILICNQDGEWQDQNITGRFETALFDREDWCSAKWISSHNDDSSVQNPILTKTFTLDKQPSEARIYICGLGYFELFINGQKIGNDVLTPYFTNYTHKVLYYIYDIASALKKGENSITVDLGNGMMRLSHTNGWGHETAPYKDRPKCRALCTMSFGDGSKETLITDTSWQLHAGPVTMNDVYVGQVYDANTTPVQTKPCIVTRSPGGRLEAIAMPTEQIVSKFTCVIMKKLSDTAIVVDCGGGTSGYVSVVLNGKKGMKFDVIHSEKLTEDGDLDQGNINVYVTSDGFQKDTYILGEDGEKEYAPKFTFHGFRYVKIEGDAEAIAAIKTIYCNVVHTNLEQTGTFSCSNQLLNDIQAAVINSTLTNFHGMPTDCPQREKNGWTGDAALSCEHTLLNFDPQQAYYKWVDDLAEIQLADGTVTCIAPTAWWGYNCGLNGPAWDIALFSVPFETYQYTGDLEILRRYYENMKKYLEHIDDMTTDGICCFGLGDWCPPTGGWDAWRYNIAVTDTCYHYMMLDIASKTAKLLGRTKESLQYRTEAETVKKAFVAKFYNEETGEVDNGTQITQLAALYFGMLDKQQAKKAFKVLVNRIKKNKYRHDLGILGAKYLFPVLCDNGAYEIAYRIATSTEFPSWGLWIKNGHKTLMETWNEDSSQNHHMFGSISTYFFNDIAGLRLDKKTCGYKNIQFAPNPVLDLTSAKASKITPNGLASIDWTLDGQTLTANIVIPYGSTGDIVVPKGYTCTQETKKLHGGSYTVMMTKA